MDTIATTTEPVGSDGATSSPDTSSSDTQTAEPTEAVSDGQGGEAVQTELLAGKYKSPEDLVKGYKELEGKLGDLGQKAKVADLIQEKYGMTPEQFQETIDAEEQARLEQEYATNPGGAALREVQKLQQQLALKEEEGKLNSFLAENPAYVPFKDKLFNLYLNVEKDKELGDIANDYFGQAIAKGQQDAYKKIEVKKNTQTTGVASTPKKGITLEDMKGMSAAEMRAVLEARRAV